MISIDKTDKLVRAGILPLMTKEAIISAVGFDRLCPYDAMSAPSTLAKVIKEYPEFAKITDPNDLIGKTVLDLFERKYPYNPNNYNSVIVMPPPRYGKSFVFFNTVRQGAKCKFSIFIRL